MALPLIDSDAQVSHDIKVVPASSFTKIIQISPMIAHGFLQHYAI
jgi:hypothetical protein